VLLVLAFLADHTGAREAHLVIDAENDDSIRVADGVGSYERERFAGPNGRVKLRYVVEITRPQGWGKAKAPELDPQTPPDPYGFGFSAQC
jgi:hypothetical protein